MRYWRNLLMVAFTGGFLAAGYLWWVLLSPFTYAPPQELPDIEPGEYEVFVYGTLTYWPVRWLVYGRKGDPDKAILEGYRRDGLDLEKSARERVEGLVVEVDERELARLDRYERLGIRYERVLMTLADGSEAWVYRRLD